MARRDTRPAFGTVMVASIFMASMVATVAPAATSSPSATARVTTPANGAATWPGLERSAFSVTGMSEEAALSRIWIGRSWPFSVDITVRMPRSSASPTASRPMRSRTPGSRSTAYSLPGPSP